jgi:hypothetical protein
MTSVTLFGPLRGGENVGGINQHWLLVVRLMKATNLGDIGRFLLEMGQSTSTQLHGWRLQGRAAATMAEARRRIVGCNAGLVADVTRQLRNRSAHGQPVSRRHYTRRIRHRPRRICARRASRTAGSALWPHLEERCRMPLRRGGNLRRWLTVSVPRAPACMVTWKY